MLHTENMRTFKYMLIIKLKQYIQFWAWDIREMFISMNMNFTHLQKSLKLSIHQDQLKFPTSEAVLSKKVVRPA